MRKAKKLMYAKVENIAVSGIAAAIPTEILDNEKHAESIENRRLRREIRYTGIRQRRKLAEGQVPSDLACAAAEAILNKLGWARESIKLLLYVTMVPELDAPSTALLIQDKLNIGTDCIAFDINLGCSGFPTSIQAIASMLQCTKGRGLLLLSHNGLSVDDDYFSGDAILFGAAGAAVALEYDEFAPALFFDQYTDGKRANLLFSSEQIGFHMDGSEILLFSLNDVSDGIKNFCNHFQIENKDIDFYIPHQAQKIIVDGLVQNCSWPDEKVLRAYEQYGNTSAVSIPLAMCANSEKFKGRVRCLAPGFGIGLAYSSMYFTLNKETVLPVIETSKHYKCELDTMLLRGGKQNDQ